MKRLLSKAYDDIKFCTFENYTGLIPDRVGYDNKASRV